MTPDFHNHISPNFQEKKMSQKAKIPAKRSEEDVTTFSMSQVQVILKMHEDTMMNFIKITIERFDNKIDALKTAVT